MIFLSFVKSLLKLKIFHFDESEEGGCRHVLSVTKIRKMERLITLSKAIFP